MFPLDDVGQLGAWHLHSKFKYNLEDKEKKLTLGKVRQTRYTRIDREKVIKEGGSRCTATIQTELE